MRVSGDAALQQSDMTTARSLAEQSLELFKKMGNQGWTAQSLALLGKVNVVQGDYTPARALYEESLTFPLRGDASSLEGLAGVVAAQGEMTWAARLWGQQRCCAKLSALHDHPLSVIVMNVR